MKTTTENTAQHTPGPYIVKHAESADAHYFEVRSVPDDCKIATVGFHSSKEVLFRSQAAINARLIAAAPELLAALLAMKADYEELARNHADAWHADEVLTHQKINSQARAALAKAKGVQS